MPAVDDPSDTGDTVSSKTVIWAFVLSFLALISLIYWLQSPPEEDVFSIPSDMPVPTSHRTIDILSAKLAHARANPRYDLGAFGNSRIVALERRHLEDIGHRYFNFSIAGTSFWTTVSTIETLAAEGKIPALSIISLDNLSQEYFGPALMTNPIDRYRAILRDAKFGFGNHAVPILQTIRAIWRSVWNEWMLVTETLNFSYLSSILTTHETEKALYRNDGSIPMREPEVWQTRFPPLAVGRSEVLIEFLAEDIRRLAHVQNTGASRIIVIESPIHPSARLYSVKADEYRQHLSQVCLSVALECHFQPMDSILKDDMRWPDSTHAPPQYWAAFILPIWQARADAS